MSYNLSRPRYIVSLTDWEKKIMKKLLLIAAGLIIAASATLFAAEQMDSMTHGSMHEMTIKRGGPKIDIRTPRPR